jgi:low-density lipoprotein receptor-related protein 1 (alpha-2-macroglobulin receptor)
MAYDWIGNNLFLSFSGPKYKISVMSLRTKNLNELPVIKTLVDKNFTGPSSITLDVENGMLYWTSFAERYHIGGKIEMARMDGTYRETLASKNVNGNSSIYWPVSLSYCKETRSLFWLDVLSQVIESINIDTKERTIRRLGNSYAQSMTILSNFLYWSDNLKGNILMINIKSSNFDKDARVFYRANSKTSFMKSADIDIYGDHVESEKQISCPGIWLNTPSDGTCVCGDGYSINAIGTSCILSPPLETSSVKYKLKCASNSFACKSGDECIYNHAMVCDGTKDCTDGSDEQVSPDGPCPQQQCEHKCDDDKCLTSEHVCDGIKNCEDGSDEVNCNKTLSMPDDYLGLYIDYCDEFLCENSECVLLDQRCDGVQDCDDGSDEKDCFRVSTSTTTPSTSFDDGSSDNNEDTSIDDSKDCISPDYYCQANKRCILVHQLCDGINQCPDNSDEAGRCSEKLCDHFSECQYFCHNAPNADGFVCSCPQHMSLETDGRTCTEVKTCDDFSTCSHTCLQLNPTKIKCKCQFGYHLKEDNFTCESEHPHEAILLISYRNILRGIHLKTRETKNYYSMSKNLIGLDFYYDRNMNAYEIVWSDITKDKIFLGKLKGDQLTNIVSIVESDISTAEAVAVDWIGKNVYWIDSSLKQIEVATKDGLHRTTLISENLMKPRSLALDSRFGYLFWSDWEENDPQIERSTLAGEERKSIFKLKTIGGGWPNGITLDYIKKRIFFLDAKIREIYSVDYNGQNPKRILKNPEYLHHPFAISIYENSMFWTDWRLSSAIIADKYSGNNVTIFYQASIQPFDVKVMHPSRQPWDYNGEGTGKEIISPCENSPCSHLCLLNSNNTYKCACPHMMRLSDNNNTECEKVKDLMLYITDKSEVRAIELQHPYSTAISTIYHTSQIIMPNDIAINPKEKVIYWSDYQLREIKSVKLSTAILPSDQKIETVLDAEINQVHSIAVDWNSNLLFLSQSIDEEDETQAETTKHQLLVTNLKGEYMAKLKESATMMYSVVIAHNR